MRGEMMHTMYYERWRGANGERLVKRGGRGSLVYANRETAVKMGDPSGAVLCLEYRFGKLKENRKPP